MAADSNGRPVEAGQKAMNGMNGHAKAARSKSARKPKSFSIMNTISRLLTWYAIITISLRCPATIDALTESSPKICKPYFQTRAIVAPYLQPYYDTYASSYVEAARPYYNTLDQRIITPVTVLGKKHGAPQVARVQAFGQAQWEKNLQPEVLKYQAILKAKYDASLGPHVNKVVAATAPYYDIARTSALQTYYGHILPTYTAVQPYVLQGYGITSEFAVNTAVPYSKWAWSTGVIFVDRTVWPRVKILYGESVEPQLVRIGERLGRYRDGKKFKAIVDEAESSISAISKTQAGFTAATTSVTPTQKSTVSPESTPILDTPTSADEGQSTPVPVEDDTQIREKAQTIVAHDLKTWQEKFAKAADEGSEDLEERIAEITNSMINNQAKTVGKSLIVELEETVSSSLKTLKSSVIAIVKYSQESEDSEEAIHAAVRKAGVAIKDKAQSIRSWRQNYDQETNSLVSTTAVDTLDILDHIRDLGLQEIGMRWAWTDGITHKDWAKYHSLKTKFDEWRYDVEKVVTEHPGLEKARAASEEVESQAMAIAESAAKELTRLKETSRWKLSAKDTSDDWSTKHMPAAAVAVGQKVLKKVSEAIAPSSQGTIESIASVVSSSVASNVETVQSVASSVLESITGKSSETIKSVTSAVSASLSSASDQASSSVAETSQGSVESIASVAKASASSIVKKASNSIIAVPEEAIESIVSIASEGISTASAISIAESPPSGKATASVSSVSFEVSDSTSALSETVSASVSSASSKVSSAATKMSSSVESVARPFASSLSDSTVGASSSVSSEVLSTPKKVWGGAMAQKVEARHIVYEDIVDDSDDVHFSEKLQSMASAAGDRYNDITKAVSEALLKSTSTQQSPVTQLAAEKYSSALSAASVALYGTEQGKGESVSSIVASRYTDAVAAASAIIYGTPTPITDSIAAQATDLYNAALSRARDHYTQARSVVSAQISGQPKPVHQEMFRSVESAYLQAVSAASSRLQAASSVVYGTPPPAYSSYLLLAQSKLSEGLSVASVQFEEAKSYVAAVSTPEPARQKLLSQIQNQYYAGIGMAHARQSEFVAAASSAFMPKQTPFHEGIYSKASANIIGTSTGALEAASSQFSSAVSQASSEFGDFLSQIARVGAAQADVVPTASLSSLASSKYTAAVAKASSNYAILSSLASENMAFAASAVSSVVIGSETPWTESAASVASENWEAFITKASSQIYGAPTPYFITRRLLSEAKEYAAQATGSVASQYSAVQSLISELVVGKEPDFTESVYNRLSSAYYTGAVQAVSSASYYAGEAYASATSVVGAVFTPPPAIEQILDSASSKVNEAVKAASAQFYGTNKGNFEQATSAAASAYSSVQSVASEKMYGTTTGYGEAAQSSISDAVASAQKAISEAIYGTKTGTFNSVTSAVGESIASATSVIGDATAKISSAVLGPEQGAVESAQARLSDAVESARSKLADFAASAGEGASAAVKQASEGVEDFASSVSSVVSSVKDEL